MITGPIQQDQQLHYGVKISGSDVDRQTIRRFRHKIPDVSAYGQSNEVRLRPGP